MTLWLIIFRSLRQHALSTAVTALSIALAGGLLMSVWSVQEQARSAFTGMTGGFDAVLGARGSALQLVLNSVFHLESSPGNLAVSDYLDIKSNRNVSLAIPIAVGDNYKGWRLVGTIPELFDKAEYAPGRHYELEPGGNIFDSGRREATVGSFAARRLGLKPGDTFHPYHGLVYDERDQHAETYVVVGVLKPSNTPADRVIWIPLAGIQKMKGHDARAAGEVSAVLVKLKGGGPAGFQMDLLYNKQGDRLTFAWPIGTIVAGFFDRISLFDKTLTLVAYLVALVAALSLLTGIYNSMNERRREIAVLRALGARRRLIFGAVILEAAAISGLGMAAAYAVYLLIVAVVAAVIRTRTGIVLDPLAWNPVLLWAPACLIALGALSGVVPAWKAYRTPVAENLSPLS